MVPLREAQRSVRQVAVTFDDGYADNAGEARRILAAAGVPATFFITVGPLGGRREVWWDRLEQIVMEGESTTNAIEIDIAGRRLWADMRSSTARQRAHLALFWRLRPLCPAVIEPILAEIETQLGVRSVERETHRWMTPGELRELSGSDGVDIGAHTVTHPFLPSLSAEQQRHEIEGSRDALERLVGTRTTLFSYPYGGPDAIAPITAELVRKAGFSMACTASGGIARADCDPHLIPRNVVGDWEAERFEKWLDHWLTKP